VSQYFSLWSSRHVYVFDLLKMIVLGDLVLLGILEFVGIVIVVFYPMEFLLLF